MLLDFTTKPITNTLDKELQGLTIFLKLASDKSSSIYKKYLGGIYWRDPKIIPLQYLEDAAFASGYRWGGDLSEGNAKHLCLLDPKLACLEKKITAITFNFHEKKLLYSTNLDGTIAIIYYGSRWIQNLSKYISEFREEEDDLYFPL